MVKIRKLSDSNQRFTETLGMLSSLRLGSKAGALTRGNPRAPLPGLSLWTHSHSSYLVPLTRLQGITGFKSDHVPVLHFGAFTPSPESRPLPACPGSSPHLPWSRVAKFFSMWPEKGLLVVACLLTG